MPRHASGLSPRQRRFIAEFLASGNVTRSAEHAGYSKLSARRIGFKTLRLEAVQKAIAEEEAARLAELRVTRDRLDAHLAEVAFADGPTLDAMRCTGRDKVQALKMLRDRSGALELKVFHQFDRLRWEALLGDGPAPQGS